MSIDLWLDCPAPFTNVNPHPCHCLVITTQLVASSYILLSSTNLLVSFLGNGNPHVNCKFLVFAFVPMSDA